MLEILNSRSMVDTSTPPWAGPDKGSPVLGRTIRLQFINGGNDGYVAVFEFECWSASNTNLCRTAGTIPTATFQGTGTLWPYGTPANTIDGLVSPWTNACFVPININGENTLQYTFPTDIWSSISRMNIIFSGTGTPRDFKNFRVLFFSSQGWRVVGSSKTDSWIGYSANNIMNNLTLNPLTAP